MFPALLALGIAAMPSRGYEEILPCSERGLTAGGAAPGAQGRHKESRQSHPRQALTSEAAM